MTYYVRCIVETFDNAYHDDVHLCDRPLQCSTTNSITFRAAVGPWLRREPRTVLVPDGLLNSLRNGGSIRERDRRGFGLGGWGDDKLCRPARLFPQSLARLFPCSESSITAAVPLHISAVPRWLSSPADATLCMITQSCWRYSWCVR